MKENYIKEHTVTTLFEGTFKIMGKVWKELFICLAPMAILIGAFLPLGLSQYFAFLGNLTEMSYSNYDRSNFLLRELSPMLTTLILGGLAFALVGAICSATAQRIVYKAYHGEDELSLIDELLYVLKHSLGRIILLMLALFVLLAGVIIAGAIGMLILSFILRQAGIVIGIIGMYVFMFAIIFKVIFSTQFVVLEDQGPIEAIKSSFKIVKGRWWRTFGILLLIGITVMLINQLITAPFMGSFTSNYFDFIFKSMQNPSSRELTQSMQNLFSDSAMSLIIPSVLSVIISFFIDNCFMVLFFIDNSIRAGVKEKPESSFSVDDIQARLDQEDDF